MYTEERVTLARIRDRKGKSGVAWYQSMQRWSVAHSEHRFPAPSSKEGYRKPVSLEFELHTPSIAFRHLPPRKSMSSGVGR